MPSSLLLALYLGIAAAPVALAWISDLPPRPFLDDLSSGLAMTAYAVMLMEFLLSGRFRFVSSKIGIDQTMRFHQLFARTLLVFVLIHPFIYTLPIIANPPPWDLAATGFLKLTNIGILTGIAGWLLLGALVLTAMARDALSYSYETWRLSHGLGAILVAALVAIHTFDSGRYSGTGPLTIYWTGLLGIAAVSMLYVYLVSPLLKLLSPFEVISVRQIAERTWELTIARRDRRPIRFKAGQFFWLGITRHPFTLRENPFSIASAPANNRQVQFVIKELGDFTRSISRISPGQRAWVDGPHGGLSLPEPDAPGVGLIAGGVGIAPLLSVLREMRARGDERPVILLYGNRREDQIVYREELENLAATSDLNVTHLLGEPPDGWSGATGLVDAQVIGDIFGQRKGSQGWTYLLCGPPAMLNAAEAGLMAHGVPASQIVSERFVYD
ncbi:ferredoxin reductase family protein [Limibacillus halophilus]|uniref:Putative ferric reductase n=1 Tax=Limibacillus halophilus TaxID=1579333 RepID=A0A839STB7_9PROT|nr:ferredoxin reductase family protein [Limibacillus halophilus]MBB3065004.1 putative ferric reductase [Limibacillus halophilus]